MRFTDRSDGLRRRRRSAWRLRSVFRGLCRRLRLARAGFASPRAATCPTFRDAGRPAPASAPRPRAPAARSGRSDAVASSSRPAFAGVGLGVGRQRGDRGGLARTEDRPLPAGDRSDEDRHRVELGPFVGQFRVRRRAGRGDDNGRVAPRPPERTTCLLAAAAVLLFGDDRRRAAVQADVGARSGGPPSEASELSEPDPPPMAKPRSNRSAASWLRSRADGAPSTTAIRWRPKWFAVATTLKPAAQVKPVFIPSAPG